MTPRRMLERWACRVTLLLAGLTFIPGHAADAVLGAQAAQTLPIIDAHVLRAASLDSH